MHEVSVASDLVALACECLEASLADSSPVLRVRAVRVRIGVWSGVVPAALNSAYPCATIGTPLEGARLDIEQVQLVAWCPQCLMEKEIRAANRLVCPDCGQYTPKIIHGLELELVSLECEDECAMNPGGNASIILRAAGRS